MNGTMANAPPSAAADVAMNGGTSQQLAMDINSYRIGVVAEKLAMCVQSYGNKDDPQRFFHLCLSLARGIDYGVANNEPPAQTSKLAPILKQVCRRRNEFYLQSAIMVLMISVKNACKLGWFGAKDSDELLILADEVGGYFCTNRDINSEANGSMPTLSSIMSRYYPQYKLGHVITSLEVKPGYGTYLFDFHITKNLLISKEERIRLIVAMKDNIDTSSCIVSPQQANILLNGRPVDKRTNVGMDAGPQAPTIVNPLLKYGTNLLQAVGRFTGHYILVIAAMSILQSSELPAPKDYEHPETAALNLGSDLEIIEGASRISLNCPISYARIRLPAKGHLCKHYQCFDLSNYIEINLKRPSWRCPLCNQPVCFTDLRVDRKMVKVLQDAGDNLSEVTISADGSWAIAPNSNSKDELHDKTMNEREGHDIDEPIKSDALSNVYDLTGEEDLMDTSNRCDSVDTKPLVHHNIQGQSMVSHPSLQTILSSPNELNQFSSAQVANGLSSRTLSTDLSTISYNMRSEGPTVGAISSTSMSNVGMAPVLTDAVSPSLNRLPDNFQGMSYATSSIAPSPYPNISNIQLQELLYGRSIPRNVNRVPSAIQALAVPTPSSQQHVRPNVSIPAVTASSAPFHMPLAPNQQVASAAGSNSERQRNIQQSHASALHMSSMTPASLQYRVTSQGSGLSSPSYNSRLPQTLSQPPHLMRSSQLPRGPVLPGAASGMGASNSPSTVQRVQLTSQQGVQMRQNPITPSPTQSVRTSSSLPSNSGVMPQAVSRTENLLEAEWRPTSRMRGALTGPAYSAALSQFMNPATLPTQTPARPSAPASSTTNNIELLLANRMAAFATRSTSDSGSPAEDAPGN